METNNKPEKQKKRLESAKKNLDRIQETIKPYIKKDKVVTRSTAGKWSDGKSLIRKRFFNVLEKTAKPSFFEGLARICDFGNVLKEYNSSSTSEAVDERAIRADWKAVGDDMHEAMGKVSFKR